MQARTPVIITFHGSDLQGIRDTKGRVTLAGHILKWVSRFVAQRADEVIIVSEHMQRYLPSRAYHVIPAGIDTQLFRPLDQDEARRQLGLPLAKHIVLFVGDPQRPEKRYWLAEAVMDQIRSRLPSAQLVVASGVPHSKMPLYMNASDALLVTSSSEGSPVAVREALACNLPVVSVDVGDLRYRIGAVSGCVLCENDQPQTIAQALETVLRRKERIAGQDILSEMDEGLLIHKVIGVYRQALSKAGPKKGG